MTATTANHWGRLATEGSPFCGTNWLESPQVLRDYVLPRFGGDWYRWLRDRYCTPPRGRAWSMCCGTAKAEQYFLKLGLVGECHGVDLSPGVLSQVEVTQGLTVRIGDVNEIRLEPQSYDVVIAWMALHHIERLEHVYSEIQKALRPGGIVILNEYVGPVHFDLPVIQVNLMETWLTRLPNDLKRWPDGSIRTSCNPNPRAVVAEDPSEAIRSDEIVPLLKRFLHVLDRVDYGGALLHHLLGGSMQCFDIDNSDHQEWLHRLYDAEQEAMDAGVINSDFTFIVAENKT